LAPISACGRNQKLPKVMLGVILCFTVRFGLYFTQKGACMAEEKSEERIRIGPLEVSLSDTIVIATMPVLAYLLTFAYRAGYLGFFHIPSQFVSFRWAEIFTVGGALMGFGWIFLTVTHQIST
jgi:hypothetical protein